MLGSERFDWIDSWRGMLILLVVFWHTLGVGVEATGGVFSAFHDWISNFHMVAFFAVSGFVWKNPDHGYVAYAFKNARRLMVPYYCFSILGLISILVLGVFGVVEWGQVVRVSVVQILIAGRPECYSPIWFLSCLFAILMVFYWIGRLPTLVVIPLMFGVIYLERFCFGSYYRIEAFNFIVLPRYLVMFGVGYLLSSTMKKDFTPGKIQRILLLVGGVIGLAVFARESVLNVQKIFAFLIPFRACAVVLSTMAVALALDCKWLSRIGRGSMTLGMLCLHKYPILAVQKLSCFKGCFETQVGLIVTVIVITVFAVAFSVCGTLMLQHLAPWALGKRLK